MFHDQIELFIRQLFDRLDIIAEETGILGFKLCRCLADLVNLHCALISERDVYLANLDNC